MAFLSIVDEDVSSKDFNKIRDYLALEGIELGQFTLNDVSLQKAKQDTLSDEEREIVIDSYPELISQYERIGGYRADMVCLYPEFKYLDFVLAKFKDIHFHYENEHWYYIDGYSGFGFLGQDGRKFIVEVGVGEHITVPEGKWQWVIPPKDNRMKAMRFFSCTHSIAKPRDLTPALA